MTTTRQPDDSSDGKQPFLHDKHVIVAAPSLAVIGATGELSGGADGFFHEDQRVLSQLRVVVRQADVVPIHVHRADQCSVSFLAVVREADAAAPDATMTLRRVFVVEPGRLGVQVLVTNSGGREEQIVIEIEVGTDLAMIDGVKIGRPASPLDAVWRSGELRWVEAGTVVSARVEPSTSKVDVTTGRLSFNVALGPGASWRAALNITVDDARAPLFSSPALPRPWLPVHVTGSPRLSALLDVSLADLEGLLLTETSRDDLFVAAGAPWFLTLFGRDALWTADMLLPVSTEIAGGTLRTLARQQGTHVDLGTGEEPGKILHELRRESPSTQDARGLPPRYFGSIDATPLWLVLLFDAWKWGMPAEEVEAMLDSAQAALCWLRDFGDADGDGLLEYVDTSGRGLANQGWRDSFDAIRWRDGRLATPAIALCEVQAYAYRAAMAGADLLDAFARKGADEWRVWAERLKSRFDATFWIDGPLGPIPAVALDGDKHPVDSVTSALGHLLGTGLINADHEKSVARYLSSPELDSGLGLRTLSSNSVGFNPLGYHTGSIWPHDTAIAARGLASVGYDAEAVSLLDGLLSAAAEFGYRLPELFAGHGASAGPPAPYPASCRPQAWSAAAAVSIVQTFTGLRADVPGGFLVASPLSGGLGSYGVHGLRVGGHSLDVEVDENGDASLRTSAPLALRGL